MYERMHEPMLPTHMFLRRLLGSAAVGFVIMGASLLVGVIGYHQLARLSWVDSLLNASMILGGMGPVDPLPTTGSKVFASAYALYSGVMLLTSVGVLLAPVVHRFLHHFHLEAEDGDE